jgi:threonylcarbamoyladenosine tRNA methylthiotransferase MtaB
MNRHYSAEEFYNCCNILRKAFPNPAITTDVIVGFPGETKEEFVMTKEYLEKVRFYEMHVFKYSKRNGTKAAEMTDQVQEFIKSERSSELLTLEKEMSLAYRKSYLGSKAEVLIEESYEINGIQYMIGHTREYVKVAVPYEEGLKGKILVGTLTEMLTDEVALLNIMGQI